MFTLDHLMLGVSDLAAGVAELETAVGIRAEFGGRHPHHGTHNALASLGDGVYLELIAPDPAAGAIDSRLAPIAEFPSLTPYLWIAAVPESQDLGEVAKTFAARGVRTSGPQSGSRVRADGVQLSWQTLWVLEPAHPLVPFFIRWERATPHPSSTAPRGASLRSFQLEAPDPAALRGLMERLDLTVPIVQGPQSRLAVEIEGPRGRLSL